MRDGEGKDVGGEGGRWVVMISVSIGMSRWTLFWTTTTHFLRHDRGGDTFFTLRNNNTKQGLPDPCNNHFISTLLSTFLHIHSLDASPKMDSVKMAVQALHHPSCTPEQRREATRWLESFQNTIGAWSISLQILTEDATNTTDINYSSERQQVAFFAAQTLKHKLVVDYAQLDGNQALGLRSTIWDLLTKNLFPTLVKTQLCLGLAALLVQSTDHSLMHTIIQELLHNTEGSGAIMTINLLSLIPEQLENKSIHMSRDQYQTQKKHLIDAHTDTVINILINRFMTSDNRVSIAQCMLSWIKIGGCSDRISKDRELLRVLFGFIAADSVIAELVSELIYLASRENEQDGNQFVGSIQPSTTSLDSWMQTLGESVRDVLIPLINTNIDTDNPDNRLESEGDKEMRAYMAILSEAGEHHLDKLFPQGHLTSTGGY